MINLIDYDFDLWGSVLKNEKGNLETRIEFRVTKEERGRIREQAEAFGLSVSEYVRRRVLGSRVDSVTDVRMLSELKDY